MGLGRESGGDRREMNLPRPWPRLAQIAVGGVLAWAALAKLGDPGGLADDVRRFQLLPEHAANLVAIVLPWVELAAAAALLTGLRARGGAVLAVALLATFTVAVGAAIARGLDFRCGCFGTADATRVGWAKLGENLGWLALALLAAWRSGPLVEPPVEPLPGSTPAVH
jgi:uncharacterized membrane protein YphA (DoxX/SURF4 family)